MVFISHSFDRFELILSCSEVPNRYYDVNIIHVWRRNWILQWYVFNSSIQESMTPNTMHTQIPMCVWVRVRVNFVVHIMYTHSVKTFQNKNWRLLSLEGLQTFGVFIRFLYNGLFINPCILKIIWLDVFDEWFCKLSNQFICKAMAQLGLRFPGDSNQKGHSIYSFWGSPHYTAIFTSMCIVDVLCRWCKIQPIQRYNSVAPFASLGKASLRHEKMHETHERNEGREEAR